MELGQRLKEARLAAGLSQRQLCGDIITRNMLSQIENGSARPSMDTLRYFAAQLGKPVSYFLDEALPEPPNQALMQKLRQTHGLPVLELLAQYVSPDPIFDPERYLLEALTCIDLARQALAEQKVVYAQTLLAQALQAGQKTPYYTQDIERNRLLLCWEAGLPVQENCLPSLEPELLLRAELALEQKEPTRAGCLLDAATHRSAQWHYLRGRVWEAQADHQAAVTEYLQAEAWDPMLIYRSLERCYYALENYKKAYEYACKQR